MDMQVWDKILVLLDSWQEAFAGPGGKYPQYYWATTELKSYSLDKKRWFLSKGHNKRIYVAEIWNTLPRALGEHSVNIHSSSYALCIIIIKECPLRIWCSK
ncbi:target of Myb protein 1-like [Canna indica]|uniref:Target of Myb protein 1-like n=1 Tax=Canna indica TaxID=4628 RepID=A0AAQ3QHB2_9LILI|nr:target of Myb protein 1-like [Canna indica]